MFQLPIPVSLVLCLTPVLAVSAKFTKPECQEFCGDVAIPFPFGIGVGCYMNENFAVTCDNSFNPPKPFLNRTGMELLGVSMSRVVQVNNPVISSSCNSLFSPTGVDMSGSPFMHSSTYNRFVAMGCDNNALYRQNNTEIVGGCFPFCMSGQKTRGCYGINCCQTKIPPYLKSYEAITSLIADQNRSCANNKTIFVVDQHWFDDIVDVDLVPQMGDVPAVLEWGKFQGNRRITETSSAFCSLNDYRWKQLSSSHLCVCGSLIPSLSSDSIRYVQSVERYG